MKFRFTTSIGGAYNFCEGAIIEPTVIDPHVQRWLDAGILIPVRDGYETADVQPSERAVSLRGRRRTPRGAAALA